jgi:hypothetical protein
MTPAQQQVLEKCYQQLSEHFERVLIVVDTEVIDEEGEPGDAHLVYWHGGSMAAIGMAEFAKDRVMRSGRKYVAPEGES